LLVIPTVFIILALVFMAIRLAPGDIVEIMLAEGAQSAGARVQTAEHLRKQFGLDKPIHEQFVIYLWSVVRGDLGKSPYDSLPVLDKLINRLPVTLELAFLALTTSLLVSIPVGIIAAIRQDTFLDHAVRILSISSLSAPIFWTGTMVLIFPAIWWRYFPPLPFERPWEDPVKNLMQMAPPAFILGLALGGSVARMVRNSLLEVLRQDYVRTAWAKGLRERVVIFRHTLKNALIPVVTLMGLQLENLLGGTVIAETIFTIPGIGRLTLRAVEQRDYAQLQANIIFLALIVLIVNIIVDISYAWIDPRVRYK